MAGELLWGLVAMVGSSALIVAIDRVGRKGSSTQK